MVSIADVAEMAGVSVTTVSHSISGKRKVSDRVRERVLQAMESLDYVPSRSAQSLASGRTRILGLIVPDIANQFFAELTHGVELAAMEHGYNVILCTTGFDHARELHGLQMVRSRAVDGLVYAAGSPPTKSELRTTLGDLPMVLVDEEVRGSQAPLFVSDNLEGGRLVARHLLELGHERAVVLEADGDLVSSQQRAQGFIEAWTGAGMETPIIGRGGFTAHGGRTALDAALGAIVRGGATAVFAANDLMAFGAVEGLEAAGLAIPDDVSVVGFDDITAGQFARPRLTTVRQDVAALGALAVERLAALLEGDSDERVARRTVLPVQLTIRDSSALVRREE